MERDRVSPGISLGQGWGRPRRARALVAAVVGVVLTVFAVGAERGRAANQYTLSSNAAGTGQINVDDDLIVYVDGVAIYDDTLTPGGAGLRPPITFMADVGDSLRIVVRDTFGGCATLSTLYLTNADGAKIVAPGFDLGCGRPSGDQGVVYDSSSFPIPVLSGTDISLSGGVPLPGNTNAGVIAGPGGRLYGMTYNGGAYNRGTIYSVKPDLTDMQVHHSFSNGADGRDPAADLIADGVYLYGVARGGVNGGGVIFKLDTTTNALTVLASLSLGSSEPKGPPGGPLLLVGNTLFGPTYGSLFRVDTDGANFDYIRVFAFEDGQNLQPLTLGPQGRLLGTAGYGGNGNCYQPGWGCGTFYSINQDGSDFVLHETINDVNRGFPGRMVWGGDRYYGTWYRGLYGRLSSAAVADTVFLQPFLPPTFANVLVGGNDRLYWTTAYGGTTSNGTVISVKKDGTDYRVEADLDGTAGSFIVGTPVQVGSRIYVTAENDVRTGSRTGNLFSLPIAGANTTPVANAASVTTAEDSAVPVTLSGFDPDGDPLTYDVVTPPAHGTLQGTAPTLTYVPAPDYNGPDSFTFRVNDGTVNSADAAVILTVTPVNDPPSIASTPIDLLEDTPFTFAPVVSDVDADPVTVVLVTPPVYGLVDLLPGGQVRYTPKPDYYGADAFTLQANDGTVASAPTDIPVTVQPVNDLPVANAQSVAVAEDAVDGLDITLSGSDVDSVTLFYNVQAAPQHGTLTVLSETVVRYRPEPNYHGPDSFTFTVGDGSGSGAPATVSITVTPVNDAPVATAQALSTPNTAALPIVLAATDVDGDPLTYVIVTPPAHGTLSALAGANVTYTPNPGYAGADSITFTASDASLTSSAATVAIQVTSTNRPPSATGVTVPAIEDTPTAPFALAATDPDGDPLTFTVVSGPQRGTLGGTFPTAIVYTPGPDFNGTDQLTFKVNDGTVDSALAVVAFTVEARNDPPVALGASPTITAEDTPLALTLDASDVDGDALTYAIVTPPAHGTIGGGTGAGRTYTPAANYFGSDSFAFTVSDGTVTSAPLVVQLTVTPVNDAPVATSVSLSAPEEVATPVPLAASDVEGDPITFVLVSGPQHGTLSGAWPNVSYTSALNYTGPDTITFRASDGQAQSEVATIAITVTPVNDAPVALGQSVSGTEDAPLPITLSASDPDGDSLTYSIVTSPTKGTVSGTGAAITYTPAADTNGADAFTYRVSDGNLWSAVATVTIAITPVNDAPVAVNDTASAAPAVWVVVPVLANDRDVDGTALTVTSAGPASNGDVVVNADGTVSYRSRKNFTGLATFSYTVSDPQGATATAVVSVTVGGTANAAPRAGNDSFTVATGALVTLDVLSNDSDPNGDPLTITSVTASNPAGALITISPDGRSLQFQGPLAGTFYRFTYTISDGRGGTASGRVTVRTN